MTSTFKIFVESAGFYYVSCFALGTNVIPTDNYYTETDENSLKLQEISVYQDGVYIGDLDISMNGWQSAKIKENPKWFLTSGEHTITFETFPPYYPEIDVLKLSTDEAYVELGVSKYTSYLENLKLNGEKNKGKQTKIGIDEDGSNPKYKSASNPSSEWRVSSYILNNPFGNYKHRMNVPVVYTYYRRMYLNQGQRVIFHTAPIAGQDYFSVDPVMYLFCDEDHTRAWANDDFDGLHPRIDVTITRSGNYYLVLRAFSNAHASTQQGSQGVVNVFQNGVLLQANAPVSGFMVDVSTTNTGLLNYFTGYSTGIPKIWLAPNGIVQPIQFHGSTYWYSPPMDYNWFNDARLRMVKNTTNNLDMRLLVSSEGAWWVFWGNCDVYGSCKQATSQVINSFPNLKASDAIQSAPATNVYNCGSWADGMTNGWFWGCLSPNNQSFCTGMNYGGANQWSTWDDFFGNNPPRYSGAVTYIRDQANATNGDIAVWSLNNNISGITHFSIRREANKHPHGYDWESKPGSLERIFHPRNSLQGNAYGNIFTYYRDASKSPFEFNGRIVKSDTDYFSFEESLLLGLTVIQHIELTENEKEFLERLNFKNSIMATLSTFYNDWLMKCKSPELELYSNPNVFFENTECEKLIEYCKKEELATLKFFSDKMFSQDESSFESQITSMLFYGVTSNKYADLMEEVKIEWLKNNYTQSGAYIAPMAVTNTKKYLKKIINTQTGTSLKKLANDKVNDQISSVFDSHDYFMVYPNPTQHVTKISFNLINSSEVTLSLYASDGTLINIFVEGEKLEGKHHEYLLDVSGLVPGIYLCKLLVDNELFIRKILVK